MRGNSAAGRGQALLSYLARLRLPWQVQSSCGETEAESVRKIVCLLTLDRSLSCS